MIFKKSSKKCKVCVKSFSAGEHKKGPPGATLRKILFPILFFFMMHILLKLLRGLYQHPVKPFGSLSMIAPHSVHKSHLRDSG